MMRGRRREMSDLKVKGRCDLKQMERVEQGEK
jgi:hypothetical protein